MTIGSWKTTGWANQAMDYAISYTATPFIGVEFQKAPPQFPTNRSRWIVEQLSSRGDLDAWFQVHAQDPRRFHYLAAFDKLSPEWTAGRPVAVVANEDPPRVSGDRGSYGTPLVNVGGSPAGGGTSWGTLLVGGLLIGGAVLWAKHQAEQIDKLSVAAGVPYPSFAEDVVRRGKVLTGKARAKIHQLTAKKGA